MVEGKSRNLNFLTLSHNIFWKTVKQFTRNNERKHFQKWVSTLHSLYFYSNISWNKASIILYTIKCWSTYSRLRYKRNIVVVIPLKMPFRNYCSYRHNKFRFIILVIFSKFFTSFNFLFYIISLINKSSHFSPKSDGLILKYLYFFKSTNVFFIFDDHFVGTVEIVVQIRPEEFRLKLNKLI